MKDQWISVLWLLISIIFVMGLAYWCTKLIAKGSKGVYGRSAIKVLERSGLGVQVNITVLQIGNRVYIVAMQGKSLTLLDVLTLEEWEQGRAIALERDLSREMPLGKGIPFDKGLEGLFRKITLKKGEDHNTNENDKKLL